MKKKTVKEVKMHKFLVFCMQISRFCANSEKFAPSHDGMTVTFRNSGHSNIETGICCYWSAYHNYSYVTWSMKMDVVVVEKCLAFCQGLVESKIKFTFNLSFGKDALIFFKQGAPVHKKVAKPAEKREKKEGKKNWQEKKHCQSFWNL